MKLLLTSGGVTNPSIARALFDLVGKQPQETSLAVIPTASNAQKSDKIWLIDDLVRLKGQGFKGIDIVDISAMARELSLPRLQEADVLYFEGGNRYHLMEHMNRSGLTAALPDLLKNKVYVGMSAGSMITAKRLGLELSHRVFEDDLDRTEDLNGLGFVGFSFVPHLNNPYFKNVTPEFIEKFTEDLSERVYALDDNSALKIVDDKVDVASEGEWKRFN